MERSTEYTKIVLSDGVERVLRYTLGSIKRIGKHPLAERVAQGDTRAILESLPFTILEGLRGGGNSEITVEQLEELIDMDNLPYVAQTYLDAVKISNSSKNDDPATEAQTENPPATPNLTSINSGQSDATISG